MTSALFLDRDGVVNTDTGFVHRIEEVRFVAGIFDLCLAFQQAGYALVVITNQSGVARGFYGESDVQALHAWMGGEFERRGVRLGAMYYCPHHPEGTRAGVSIACECRKPRPGMLLRARDELGVDLPGSLLIGDRESDILAGRSAGLRATVKMNSTEPGAATQATAVVATLAEVLPLARREGWLPGRPR